MTSETQQRIDIPAPMFQITRVTIVGTEGLLTNRPSEKAREGIISGGKSGAKTGRPPRDPEAEFRAALHVIDADAGRYGFPTSGIKDCLVRAGKALGEVMLDLQTMITLRGELAEIVGPPPRMREDFINIGGRGGSGGVVYRPEFFPWKITVDVVHSPSLITEQRLLALFQQGGAQVGIGCWRPEKGGAKGTFDIEDAMIIRPEAKP